MTMMDGVFYPPPRYPANENPFRTRTYTLTPVPAYDPGALPALVADDHPVWVAMYDKAWQLAFGHLRQPEPESGFVANFIDTAFNDNTFMWDSCFMMMFGNYGRRVFPFMGTLDNFYGKQHPDGFMCREISTYTGRDLFTPIDPSSTGPPIMAWTEWIDYQKSADIDRLRAVFPALMAYRRWWRDWRTWPDGSYFTDGWGSGMDNQNRVPDSTHFHHHYTWVDATMQAALDCKVLRDMARVIGRGEFDAELEAEYALLREYVNANLWDEAAGFYYDRAPDGALSRIKSVGAYWGLLAGIVPEGRTARMIAHLDDPAQFNRPHRVPSQAADSDGYQPGGGYWLGGVWTPTNYMVLQALTGHGDDDLAYAIARNHVDNVAQVFAETGTVWENYAPEKAVPGQPARPDFVGWTGNSAITIPLEYLIGLRPVLGTTRLVWDIRLTERHGVQRYPFGLTNTLDLICARRTSEREPPRLAVTAAEALTLEIRWGGGVETLEITPGAHQITPGSGLA